MYGRLPLVQKRRPASAVVGGFTVDVYFEIVCVEKDWRALEMAGHYTYYQTFAWCSSWARTVGISRKIQPLIIVAKNHDEDIAFILPFQISTRFGIKILEWLSQPENNYGTGLFSSPPLPSSWFENNFAQLLAVLPSFDVVNFQNMPAMIGKAPNPLHHINQFAAANSSYVTTLHSDFDVLLLQKRSAKSISKMRRRDERLDELGVVSFEAEKPGTAAGLRLVEVCNDKDVQLSELGIHGVFAPEERAFLAQLQAQTIAGRPSMGIFRLALDGKTLSTLVGGLSGSTFWLMLTALAPQTPKQFSPGDILLRRTIEHCCTAGFDVFDFSNGEVGYKKIWCDDEVLLHNYFSARSIRGLPVAAALLGYHTLKRQFKKSPLLRRLFESARRKFRGKSSNCT